MTKQQLKQFAHRFSHEDWGKICADTRGWNLKEKTPEEAEVIAWQILNPTDERPTH